MKNMEAGGEITGSGIRAAEYLKTRTLQPLVERGSGSESPTPPLLWSSHFNVAARAKPEPEQTPLLRAMRHEWAARTL